MSSTSEETLLTRAAAAVTAQSATDLAVIVKEACALSGSKVRLAKIVRKLLEDFAQIPGSVQVQIRATKEAIEWAKANNRTFLRQALEGRLISL